jgi:hypothetical protein
MSSAYTSLGSFLHKADADKMRELLAREGLNATVRAARDGPPGYSPPAWLKGSGEKGFTLWVQGADPKIAEETFLRLRKEAFPPTAPHCDVCGINVATRTIYTFSGGKRTARHLCDACHGEEIFPPLPDQS